MIDTPQARTELVERALTKECVALDTEFVWNRTYYPKLGVIQLAIAGDDCHLIDTVALEDLSMLGGVLAHPDIELILHDAVQDLTILRQATGAFPRNIFDTRCAAGLANMSTTTSLAELLANTIGVELEKTETRTDWTQRPLSDKQLAYAIEDVCYMHEVRDVLRQRVAKIGRTQWLAEALAADLNKDVQVLEWETRAGALEGAALLVNTTSLGMTGQPELELDLALLPESAVVNDLVYSPLTTALLTAARECGNIVIDGLGMLLHQARPGFATWFGVEPQVTAELRTLVEADLAG